MKWNPFKKGGASEEKKRKIEEQLAALPGAKDMNMFQRFAMRRMLALPPEEQAKVMQKALKPENIHKHKSEILAQLDAMKKAGQMSDDQYRLAKRKLGL
jgi:hypothetical protein